MEKTEKVSFVKGAAILGIAGLVCKVIGAFFRIPLYNMLGDGMQYYEAVYPYYATLITISTAGLPTAISRMVAERVTLGDYLGARKVFRKAQLLLFGFGVLTAGLMYAFADMLAMSTVGMGAAPSFRAMAPALLIVSLLCSYRGYLQGMQRMTGTAVSQLVEQVGKLVIGLYLASRWMTRGLEYGALGAVVGVTASELMALLVIAGFYLRRKGEYDRPQSDLLPVNDQHIYRDLMLIAIPVTIGGSIMSITGIVDASMIKRTLLSIGFDEVEASMRYVCLRTNVSSIINMPAVLTVALAMSLVPAVSAARTRHDREGIQNASNMGIKLSMLVGMPCTVGLLVLAGPAIDLLYDIDPQRLGIATALMRTSAVSVVFLSLTQTLTGVLQGLGKQNVPVVNLAIGAAVKIAVMTVLMRNPAIEIQGAAISNVACYLVAGLLDLICLVRYTHLKIQWLDAVVKPVLAAVVMGAAAFFTYVFVKSVIPSNSVASLAAILAGGVLYLAVVLLSGMFTLEDRALMAGNKILSRLSKR